MVDSSRIEAGSYLPNQGLGRSITSWLLVTWMKHPSCPSLPDFLPLPFSLEGGSSPNLCLMNSHHLFRQTDYLSIAVGHDLRARFLSASPGKKHEREQSSPRKKVLALTGWHLLASQGRVRVSQRDVASLEVHEKGWRQSSPIQVKQSVEDRTVFSFSSLFLLAV